MDLQHYDTATSIKEDVANGTFFARVTKGNRAGSLGRIIDVKSPYFSQHFYRLEIKGRRAFWLNADKLEFVANHTGETVYNKVDETPCHNDMLGREIQVGQTVSFPRMITSGSVEMIMGTVRRISASGSVYVKAFLKSDNEECGSQDIRIGTPNRAMILDRSTVDSIMLAKMSVFR